MVVKLDKVTEESVKLNYLKRRKLYDMVKEGFGRNQEQFFPSLTEMRFLRKIKSSVLKRLNFGDQ